MQNIVKCIRRSEDDGQRAFYNCSIEVPMCLMEVVMCHDLWMLHDQASLGTLGLGHLGAIVFRISYRQSIALQRASCGLLVGNEIAVE